MRPRRSRGALDWGGFMGNTMKFLKKVLLTVLPLLLVAAGCLVVLSPRPQAAFNPITVERKATHMITYYNEGARQRIALCTGTAVGPHALMTDLHCDEGESLIISLDMSVKQYHIIGIMQDGRDHIIYHLDGPEFTNYVTVVAREAVIGERVISYGNGKGDYPQHTYVGEVIVAPNGGDTSEVDAADGTHYFDIPAISGDSGSAVYGLDGNVVALITYGDDGELSVGFALAFTPEQLEKARQ